MIKARFIPGNEDLTDVFAIRKAVFVEEQHVEEAQEFDGKDVFSMHVLVWSDDVPAGTGRIWFENLETVRLGRIAVLKEFRGKKIGDLLVRMMLNYVLDLDVEKVVIHAQSDKLGFYKRYGFKTTSESYMEDGIEHNTMELLKKDINLRHECTNCGACEKGQ